MGILNNHLFLFERAIMATYTRKLKDASGNYVVPATRASCVYMENDSSLSLLTFYPIGTVYQSFNEESPASLFGGEWEKMENTFLYGSGTKSVGDTGGEEEHVLTIAELAKHDHPSPTSNDGYWRYGGELNHLAAHTPGVTNPVWARSTQNVKEQGEDQPHNNMPPYIVCNIWKRTA